jgi:adenylate kinase family enzyme
MKKCYLFFFLGQSGAGKDTQIRKVLKHLKEQNKPYFYISNGDEVRKRSKKADSGLFFPKHMTRINSLGKLQPPVLPIYFCLSKIEKAYKEGMVIIINGSPRSKAEFLLWQMLMKTGYLPKKAEVIYIDTPYEECARRIKKRKRVDTQNDAVIKRKMAWFKPVKRFLEGEIPKGFKLITVNGLLKRNEQFEIIKKRF